MNDDANIAAEAARWAADDGLWTTQETVEANLIRFAQSVIKKATEQKDHEIEILRRDIDDKARVIESRAAHASDALIDAIVGDLVRETNIFPNQVERAKELIRERLNEKGIKETCQREP